MLCITDCLLRLCGFDGLCHLFEMSKWYFGGNRYCSVGTSIIHYETVLSKIEYFLFYFPNFVLTFNAVKFYLAFIYLHLKCNFSERQERKTIQKPVLLLKIVLFKNDVVEI